MNKTIHLMATMCIVAICAIAFASCQSGEDCDEMFNPGVTGQVMQSPAPADITITPSEDGSKQTISWPLIKGAGGFELAITDKATGEIIDAALVDGSSYVTAREEDMNYQLSIRTLGNEKYGNTDAPEPTVMDFTTFTPAYAAIPAGADLCQYFTENPAPATGEAVYYDLEGGATYTVPTLLDFGAAYVVLRSNSKSNYANIVYGEEGAIEFCGGIGTKYLNFDCSASTKPVFAFSATPAIEPDADHNNHYQITNPFNIQKCNFEGVRNMFLFDNKKKYCLKMALVNETKVHMISEDMANNSVFQIYDGGGFINDLNVTNSTFWNTGASDQKYFVRYNNSGRADRAGYTSSKITYTNNTFYNVCYTGQWGNYDGIVSKAETEFIVMNNIFYDCGSGQIPRRILKNNASKFTTTCVFNNNTYWYNGAPEENNSQYDSGYQLQGEPAFEDAANGNFKLGECEQKLLFCGDPRWIEE